MRRLLAAALLVLAGCASQTPTTAEDPYLWLENIDDPRALGWVAQQNEKTKRELASQPGFEEMRAHAQTVLSSESRVPSLSFHGNYVYTLWKDASHPRGIYRRTTLDELRKAEPQWTTVLDIDAMSKRDSKMWVFKGMECVGREQRRCLVSLSPGGGDAVEIREFDTETLSFVPDGFMLPVAKSAVEWIDENAMYVATDFGPGSLTPSGYPRIVKRWTRGTPLSSAVTLHEASPSSVRAGARQIHYDGGTIDLITEDITFYNTKRWVVEGTTLRPLDIPPSAIIAGALGGKLVVALEEKWGALDAGSVVMVDPRTSQPSPAPLIARTASTVIENTSVRVGSGRIFVPMLENVRGKLVRITPEGVQQTIRFPENGALSINTVNDETGDTLVTFETFTEPPTLYLVRAGSDQPERILSEKPTFNGSQFETTQQWAVSSDGTRIPYFVVGKKGFKRDGSNPTYIFSYGGFRSSLTPSYSGSYEPHHGAYGKLWLERGGVFVLANIRGGGEFGPEWHSSVLKENRNKVYEDFEAVARDLVRTGITSPKHLGIEGRSNGGLLTLSAIARHAELYGAVITGAPLSDMKRYQQLLAGASWAAEYGDNSFSPYHAFRPGMNLPPIFVYASTRDDRVHPGHARKTVAKLQDMGYRVLYFENVEGGHSGTVTAEQLAYRIALSYAHFWRWLQ